MKLGSLLLLAPVAIALVACSPETPADQDRAAPDSTVTEPVVDAETPEAPAMQPDGSQTVGGDGSQITLNELRAEDTENMPGELACSFRTPAGAALMVAGADVSDTNRPVAVVNNNDYAERLMSATEGGFGTLETAPGTFASNALSISIVLGDETLTGATTEETSRIATMTVQRADGASRAFDGEWVCGP